MPHFVYMLRCKGRRIYTGYATNVEARFQKHCAGKAAKFTKTFPPSEILRVFECATKGEALSLEARIKRLGKAEKETLACGADTPISSPGKQPESGQGAS